MKIVINNIEFGYDTGCRLLKLKHTECPMKELEDIWEDIVPMTFKEIATTLRNTEQRRVAMGCLGLERLVKEVKPKLLNKKTLKKQTTWVNDKGELKTKKFNDTYELYEVSGEVWGEGAEGGWRKPRAVHYVKCKDTSTDREYFIWVDAESVYRTNDDRHQRWYSSDEDYGKMINAIQAIAWTIQTDVPKHDIEKIIRQGDCVLIKKRSGVYKSDTTRHLTEQEYKELLVLES
jgi:hypothetical protein